MANGCPPGFELKSSYQRNMLVSMLLAFFLSVMGGVIALIADPPPSTIVQEPASGFTAKATLAKAGSPLRAGSASISALLNPYAQVHRGFLGFRRINPVPEYPSLPKVGSVDVSVPDPGGPVIDNSGPGRTDPGSGDADDGEMYVALPDDYFIPTGSGGPRNVLNREIEVLTQVDPEYPRIALDRLLEGRIAVLVYVDAQGRLSKFPEWLQGERRSLRRSLDGVERTFEYAMTEDPADWFFGANFLKVLPRWQFVPRIENGRPVDAPLIIKYTFCVAAGCLKYELVPVQSEKSTDGGSEM